MGKRAKNIATAINSSSTNVTRPRPPPPKTQKRLATGSSLKKKKTVRRLLPSPHLRNDEHNFRLCHLERTRPLSRGTDVSTAHPGPNLAGRGAAVSAGGDDVKVGFPRLRGAAARGRAAPGVKNAVYLIPLQTGQTAPRDKPLRGWQAQERERERGQRFLTLSGSDRPYY